MSYVQTSVSFEKLYVGAYIYVSNMKHNYYGYVSSIKRDDESQMLLITMSTQNWQDVDVSTSNTITGAW